VKKGPDTISYIAELLPIAAQLPIRQVGEACPLEEANRTWLKLKRGPVHCAKVLIIQASHLKAS
jgi:hypothetical protein